jgi:hypothetical protein
MNEQVSLSLAELINSMQKVFGELAVRLKAFAWEASLGLKQTSVRNPCSRHIANQRMLRVFALLGIAFLA